MLLNNKVKTVLFTLLALFAFAANSVLCRLALGQALIDANSFTIIRLFSGAVVLLLIIQFRNNQNVRVTKGSWFSGFMLFLYALTFSYAYISLDTATGALILFGSVQITMMVFSLLSGDRLHPSELVGMLIAFLGFTYLFLPGLTTPPIAGASLMLTAGIAWGLYSIRGRGSENPLFDTAYNFLRTMPLTLILVIVVINKAHTSPAGILLAIISGGLASGIGYAIWYRALGSLTSMQAAVVQLLVPVIAALGGILFVSEMVTMRLIISAIMILGGILLVVLGKHYFDKVSFE